MTKGPRKAPAKKAVAPKEEPRAREDEAVAEAPLTDAERRHLEDHVIPAAVAAWKHCSECTAKDDLTTVGVGDAARDYCPVHKPVNA